MPLGFTTGWASSRNMNQNLLIVIHRLPRNLHTPRHESRKAGAVSTLRKLAVGQGRQLFNETIMSVTLKWQLTEVKPGYQSVQVSAVVSDRTRETGNLQSFLN